MFETKTIMLLIVTGYCVMCEKNRLNLDHNSGNIERIDSGVEKALNSLENSTLVIQENSHGHTRSELVNSTQVQEKSGSYGLGTSNKKGQGQQKRKRKQQQGLAQRILPMMIIPFLISTALIPIMLFIIKVLWIKAAIIAKIAVTIGLLSFFKKRKNEGGVYNYNAWKMR